MSFAPEHLGARDFARIARAIAYIDAHWREQPGLDELARAAGLSRFHFSRLFARWAGISPRQYLQHVTGNDAKRRLRGRESVLDAALASGLSGPGRLHDLIVTLEAMSPAEYAEGGAGVCIDCGIAPTPFGLMVSGRTARGICYLGFVPEGSRDRALTLLREEWPRAELRWSPASAHELAALLWPAAVTSTRPAARRAVRELRLCVRATNFQLRVWRALLATAPAQAATYGELARRIGRPGAARAVGRAVGSNPVAWLIPCHRVLRESGQLGGYRWDPARKRTMLAYEQLAVLGPEPRSVGASRSVGA